MLLVHLQYSRRTLNVSYLVPNSIEDTNGQSDKWTDTRNRIGCILAENVTSGGSNFNDFPDNHFRMEIS